MTASTATRKFNALLASFERRRPMRAGSLIVTIYGDAIVPRGGSLWLGSLLDMMAGFGVEAGLVRTAMSRLVADGWFERTRVGRNSYYRLSSSGAAEFATATTRIYRADHPAWSGEMDIVIITATDSDRRNDLRERMLRDGYGQAAVNVMLRPRAHGAEAALGSANVIGLVTQPDNGKKSRALAKACWQLDKLDASYRQFLKAFGPVAGEIADGASLGDAQAFQLRTLLIHDWRRIVLRDPLLPAAMLPEDWPGTRALELVGGVYRQILAASERWLDRHALNEDGPLPASTLANRFSETRA
jgi:phenylacetic acid degradation operon negative regulatory protein